MFSLEFCASFVGFSELLQRLQSMAMGVQRPADLMEKAGEKLKQAVAADNAKDYKRAAELYKEGVQGLLSVLKSDDSLTATQKDSLRLKVNEYASLLFNLTLPMAFLPQPPDSIH